MLQEAVHWRPHETALSRVSRFQPRFPSPCVSSLVFQFSQRAVSTLWWFPSFPLFPLFPMFLFFSPTRKRWRPSPFSTRRGRKDARGCLGVPRVVPRAAWPGGRRRPRWRGAPRSPPSRCTHSATRAREPRGGKHPMPFRNLGRGTWRDTS